MLFLVLPCLVAADPQSLRGSVDDVACTGSGGLSQDAPSCYGGQVLVESFSLHVLSYDGSTGIVDMKAEGPQTAECEGAEFQNDDNAITIENDHGCGLANYEYSVRYCPDQDHVIINLVKPYDMRVVLQSQTCPSGAGEVPLSKFWGREGGSGCCALASSYRDSFAASSRLAFGLQIGRSVATAGRAALI
ncbi:unnamed protein product [Symbiodinium sp. CCMP2456]|nr:unnamed protein product [Symbiodinium sp. CCMP2456]